MVFFLVPVRERSRIIFDRARHKGGSGLCPQGARVADAVPLTNPGIHTHTSHDQNSEKISSEYRAKSGHSSSQTLSAVLLRECTYPVSYKYVH